MEQSVLQQALLALHTQAAPLPQADRAAVIIPPNALYTYMSKLRHEQRLAFNFLLAHTAVHWEADQKLELLYQLYSTEAKHYCLVSSCVPIASPVIDSLSSLWPIAEWLEREVYDMFGVRYRNHPDLRRLLLDDDWQGFPLRKDYKDDFMLERP